MTTPAPVFNAHVASRYDTYLRSLFFEPYAADAAARLQIRARMRVLELACGTGIVTRQLLGALPGDATLVATDFSEQMLAIAQEQVSPDPRLAFQQADATALPFDDGSFDAAVCQFGLMFFPDKPKGLREMRRVLTPGGQLLLSTWDSLHHNPVARIADETVRRMFPGMSQSFFEMPHHMHDAGALEQMVHDAGFADVSVQVLDKRGHSTTTHDAATGVILGTPFAVQLAGLGVSGEAVVAALSQALTAEYGTGAVETPLRALVVTARA